MKIAYPGARFAPLVCSLLTGLVWLTFLAGIAGANRYERDSSDRSAGDITLEGIVATVVYVLLVPQVATVVRFLGFPFNSERWMIANVGTLFFGLPLLLALLFQLKGDGFVGLLVVYFAALVAWCVKGGDVRLKK